MSPTHPVLIRGARIEREPLLLFAHQRTLPRLPVDAAAAAPREAAAPAALAAPAAVPASDAVRLAEQDRLLRESIAAERQRVLERAREQGHKAGVEQGRADCEAQLDTLRQLVGSVRAALDAGIDGAEELMVEIAFEAVAKILGEALARRDGVQAAVREVMRGVREREHLTVRLSPRDHRLLADGGGLSKHHDAQRVELVADERVELGGCLIETAGGTLDGRLETQLQRLRDTLVGVGQMSAEAGGA